MIDLAAQYTFGTNGNIRPFLKEGWSIMEADFNWTEGTRSRLLLPMPDLRDTLTLEISLNPMLMPPVFSHQRIVVAVNGHDIAEDRLTGGCALAFEVPDAALAGATALNVELHCPDAMVPSEIGANEDPRRLGVAVREIMLFTAPGRPAFTPKARPPLPGNLAESARTLTFLALPELAGCFESLGHNGEFGVVQAQMGYRGQGLLRDAAIPIQKLVEGIDLEFDGIDAPGNLVSHIAGPGDTGGGGAGAMWVRDKRYGTVLHFDRVAPDTAPDAALATAYRAMTERRRAFIADLKSGGRIFVFQHPAARGMAHIRPIINLLRSHGPNALLFVTESGRQQPGAVEQIDEDLFQGWVQTLAPPENIQAADMPSWISICANTYRLWREAGGGST